MHFLIPPVTYTAQQESNPGCSLTVYHLNQPAMAAATNSTQNISISTNLLWQKLCHIIS